MGKTFLDVNGEPLAIDDRVKLQGHTDAYMNLPTHVILQKGTVKGFGHFLVKVEIWGRIYNVPPKGLNKREARPETSAATPAAQPAPKPLSPNAKAAVPEIADWLEAEAFNRTKSGANALRMTAAVLRDAAGIESGFES